MYTRPKTINTQLTLQYDREPTNALHLFNLYLEKVYSRRITNELLRLKFNFTLQTTIGFSMTFSTELNSHQTCL